MIRALALALLAAPAWGHDAPSGIQYSPYCCNAIGANGPGTGDCAPIPPEAVQATPEGYLVTLTPEDHPRVKARLQRLFRYPDNDPSNDRGASPEALPPQDDDFHACVLPNSQELRCFIPGRSVF